MTHPAPQSASLEEAYAICCGLHRTHGRSYYLATKLLPAWKRRHVHALYGFTRSTDDIVDAGGDSGGPARAARLGRWADQFYTAIEGTRAPADPVLRAARHTIAAFGLPRGDFDAFFASMRMDLHVRSYADYAALLEYMEGSAAVIGTMMLPILLAPDDGPGPVAAAADRARESARQLGLAFQLTNFIRDVAEDLDRGRVYLPQADLDRFGVTTEDLAAAVADERATPAIKELVAFEVQRARKHYAAAAAGIPLLERSSQACIRAAYCVYGAILTEIERQDYDVFARRAVVPTRKRLTMAARCLTTRAGRPVRVPGSPADAGRMP